MCGEKNNWSPHPSCLWTSTKLNWAALLLLNFEIGSLGRDSVSPTDALAPDATDAAVCEQDECRLTNARNPSLKRSDDSMTTMWPAPLKISNWQEHTYTHIIYPRPIEQPREFTIPSIMLSFVQLGFGHEAQSSVRISHFDTCRQRCAGYELAQTRKQAKVPVPADEAAGLDGFSLRQGIR